MQFQADILGVPVVRPKMPESTAQGAAFLAGLGVGFWRDAAEIDRHWTAQRSVRAGAWMRRSAPSCSPAGSGRWSALKPGSRRP